jgi:hypothetical protein
MCALLNEAESEYRKIRALLEREGHLPSTVVALALLRLAAEVAAAFPDLGITKPVFLGLAGMCYAVEHASANGHQVLNIVVDNRDPKAVS